MAFFTCQCEVCTSQVIHGATFEQKKTRNLDLLQGKRILFAQLVEYMLPPNDKVKGC